MKSAIITVPERAEVIKPLIEILEQTTESVKIFMDEEHNGHWWNLWRCMEIMLGSAGKDQPVDLVRWVPIEKVTPNDYNPNNVAKKEMGLLYRSILHDGYTQPVVTIYDPKKRKYIIIDGFHRYYVCKVKKDIRKTNKGMLPIVVLNKDVNERMAATIRHNRARGEHSLKGMSNIVYKMLKNGMLDSEVCNELGMSPEELLKLKHITGYSYLFRDHTYNHAWESEEMIRLRIEEERK